MQSAPQVSSTREPPSVRRWAGGAEKMPLDVLSTDNHIGGYLVATDQRRYAHIHSFLSNHAGHVSSSPTSACLLEKYVLRYAHAIAPYRGLGPEKCFFRAAFRDAILVASAKLSRMPRTVDRPAAVEADACPRRFCGGRLALSPACQLLCLTDVSLLRGKARHRSAKVA